MYRSIYDGTFTGTLTAGSRVTAELLLHEGIEVQTDETFTLLGADKER